MHRAITIGGIKVRPRWKWSADFKNWHARQARTYPDRRLYTPRETAAQGAVKYAVWLAHRDRVSLPPNARAFVVWNVANTFIHAVTFTWQDEVDTGEHGTLPGGGHWRTKRQVMVSKTIDIPNPDPLVAHWVEEVSVSEAA